MYFHDDIIRIANSALENYGPSHQMKKCAEELLELSVELARFRHDGEKNEKQLVDEIADVWFTTLQVASYVGIEKIFNRLRVKAFLLENKMSPTVRSPSIPCPLAH